MSFNVAESVESVLDNAELGKSLPSLPLPIESGFADEESIGLAVPGTFPLKSVLAEPESFGLAVPGNSGLAVPGKLGLAVPGKSGLSIPVKSGLAVPGIFGSEVSDTSGLADPDVSVCLDPVIYPSASVEVSSDDSFLSFFPFFFEVSDEGSSGLSVESVLSVLLKRRK